MRRFLTLSFLSAAIFVTSGTLAQNGPYQYYPLTPCRAIDTRGPVAPHGGPVLGQDATRNFAIRGFCGVPTTAKAVSLNVTVTQATQASWLAVWPSGQPRPWVSMINFEPSDPALANGVIVGLSTGAQDLAVYNNFGTVHLLVDVTGYFQ